MMTKEERIALQQREDGVTEFQFVPNGKTERYDVGTSPEWNFGMGDYFVKEPSPSPPPPDPLAAQRAKWDQHHGPEDVWLVEIFDGLWREVVGEPGWAPGYVYRHLVVPKPDESRGSVTPDVWAAAQRVVDAIEGPGTGWGTAASAAQNLRTAMAAATKPAPDRTVELEAHVAGLKRGLSVDGALIAQLRDRIAREQAITRTANERAAKLEIEVKRLKAQHDLDCKTVCMVEKREEDKDKEIDRLERELTSAEGEVRRLKEAKPATINARLLAAAIQILHYKPSDEKWEELGSVVADACAAEVAKQPAVAEPNAEDGPSADLLPAAALEKPVSDYPDPPPATEPRKLRDGWVDNLYETEDAAKFEKMSDRVVFLSPIHVREVSLELDAAVERLVKLGRSLEFVPYHQIRRAAAEVRRLMGEKS
jgi:hypothetical protein